jgi:hypothetical protein
MSATEPPPQPRQRWRVTFRRGPEAAGLGGRDLQAAIEENLATAGAPTTGRTQLAVGLSSGLAAEHELLDVILTERWPVSRARTTFAAALPLGHELIDCFDVWLGEPALAAQARGAEYRVQLSQAGPTPGRLRDAAQALLAADRLERSRVKGDRTVAYDLRSLIADVQVEGDEPPIVLRIAVRIDPERGTGRPEEVVAALADACGAELVIASLTRTRVWLAGEVMALSSIDAQVPRP